MPLIDKRSDIPETPFYVLANDPIMAQWGATEGKVLTLVFPCESEAQAERVKRYAQAEGEKRVRIAASKPRLDLRVHAYHLIHERLVKLWEKGA